MVQLRTAYLGAIAGRNDGVIYNCAAAGYSITGNAYQGSVLYLGGFTGYNSGTIRSGSVSCPAITANSNYARLYTGGFAGGSSGLIHQSYAMAAIEILQLRGDGVVLGGFMAENTGSVRNSYCATALTSPGADTYGFAPATGSISSCYYLSGGTYRFVGQVHLYDYNDPSGARAVNESALKKLSLSGFGAVRSGNTYHHSNTQNSTGVAYPYPGSITTTGGSRIHYGDWVTHADLGTLGMVYWEHEEGGSNPGYHFSYAQRTEDYRNGTYALAGGVVDPLPEEAPSFVKDYYAYYKTPRGYHPRSLNSNNGWNVTSSLSFLNMPILQYSSEIRSAVLLVHGEKTHSRYFSETAYQKLRGSNKELLIIPGASHTDLYDQMDIISFEKLNTFFTEYLK